MKRWMKMTKRDVRLVFLGAVILVALSACGPQLAEISLGPGSWIDKPLANSTIPLAPYEVVSHASSGEGVAAFELAVDGQPVSTNDVSEDQYGETLAYITQVWIPTAPGVYELSVRAMNPSGDYGPQTSVMVTVGEEEEEQEEEAAPSATPTPAEVDVEIEPEECIFEAAANLFCRLSNDTRFEAIDSLTPGEMAPVVGESSDGFYWFVTGPNSGRTCSVPKGERYGEVSGDCSGLPEFTPMPTPVDTPTDTEPPPTPTSTPTPTLTPIPPPA